MVGPLRSDDGDSAGPADQAAGSTEPGYPRRPDHLDGPERLDAPDGPGDPARAERIAELAAKLAAIESRDRRATDRRSGPVTGGSTAPQGSSGAPPASVRRRSGPAG